MAKRLALTLIVAGAIGTCAGLLNVNKAEKISTRIRDEPRYSQLTDDKREIELEKNPLMKKNEIYGGLSAFGALASMSAISFGSYLLKKRMYLS